MLLIAAAVVCGAGAASAQELSLRQISNYFNTMTTAQGGFQQFNADGTIDTGDIYIRRPGRIRFEYDPPSEALVMASGGQLAIFDPRSNTGPDRYPVNQTPLSVILRQNVDLRGDDMVTGVSYDGVATRVRAQDPDHPEYGSIELVFTANPVALRQWIVRDEFGTETTVVLEDLQLGGTVRNILFNINAEMRNRGF